MASESAKNDLPNTVSGVGEVDRDTSGDLFGQRLGLASGPGTSTRSTDHFTAADGAMGSAGAATGERLAVHPAPISATSPLREGSGAHLAGGAPLESGEDFVGFNTGLPGSGFQSRSGSLPASAQVDLNIERSVSGPQVGNTPGYGAQEGFGSAKVAEDVLSGRDSHMLAKQGQ